MLKYEDIIDAPVTKLKAAVDDWSEMAKKLDTLATDATDGMKAKADKASWEGVNAGVTRAFIGKTAKEFADAAAEAKGVKLILEEGYLAIKKAKEDLENIRDHEGPAAHIRVDGNGKVTAKNPLSQIPAARHDPDYSDLLREEQRNIESWQKRIDLIVDTCNDTDVALKNTLEANVTDRKDFNAPTYTKLDQEEAARAAALAGKGRDLTHSELQQLNELLKDNNKSVEFSKNFYEKLGPEKSLAFFGQLSTDTYEYGKAARSASRTSNSSRRTSASTWPPPPTTRNSPTNGARSSARWVRSAFRCPSTTTAGRSDTSCSAGSCGTGTTTRSSSIRSPSTWRSCTRRTRTCSPRTRW